MNVNIPKAYPGKYQYEKQLKHLLRDPEFSQKLAEGIGLGGTDLTDLVNRHSWGMDLLRFYIKRANSHS